MAYQPELPWTESAGADDRTRTRRRRLQAAPSAVAAAPTEAATGHHGRATGPRPDRPDAGRRAPEGFVVDEPWRLDDATRRAGRRGLAQARAALARAAAREDAA